MRTHYAIISEKLESRLLKVSREDLTVLLKENAEEREYGNLPSWNTLDWELQELPTALWYADPETLFDWSYMVDLDSELFSINNRIVFDLSNIPWDRWAAAFSEDEYSFEICPEASAGFGLPGYFTDTAELRDTYVSTYQQYATSRVDAISSKRDLSLRQLIALATFHQFVSSHATWFSEHLPATSHDDFAFHEMAYAVLSFAAGSVYFDEPSRYVGSTSRKDSRGFLVDTGEDGEPVLMPILGSGCHAELQKPGSSPGELIFWFEGVLVSLLPDNAFHSDVEAVIGKSVLYGRNSGKTQFQLVLFPIRNAVLLEVDNSAITIRRSGIVPICEKDVGSVDDGEDCSTQWRLPSNYRGFVALQRFFAVASRRNIPPFGRGRLPVEIYRAILKFCDKETHHSCARVSRMFQTLCDEQFPFSCNLNIVQLEPFSPKQELCGWISTSDSRDLATLGTFHFYDTRERATYYSPLVVGRSLRPADEEWVGTWCPVIGNVGRPSIISQTAFRLLLRKL